MTNDRPEVDDAMVDDPVDAAFAEFDRSIQPSQAFTASRRKQLRRLSEFFEQAGITTFPTGSQVRSTAISDVSDIDVLAVTGRFEQGSPRDPQTVLRSLETILTQRGLDVDRSTTTLCVEFDRDIRIDITPAQTRGSDSRSDFLVPDALGTGWMDYAPRSHDALVENAAARLGTRFRPMVRMLKWWSKHNSNAWQSFVIERLVNDVFTTNLPAYPLAMGRYFDSDVVALSTDRSAIPSLERSRTLVRRAVALNLDEPQALSQATTLWRGVFGDRFPRISA